MVGADYKRGVIVTLTQQAAKIAGAGHGPHCKLATKLYPGFDNATHPRKQLK